MQSCQYVVSKVASSDGIGGVYESDYAYAGGKTDLSGRGFLGFNQVTVRDPKLHTTQTTTYRMDFPFTGAVASQVKVFTPSNGSAAVTLSSVANTYQTDPACGGATPTAPPYAVALCTSTAQSNDTDGSPFPSVTTSNTYDSFGNVLTSTSLVSDGSSKVTTNTWLNDTTNWFLGRLLTSNVNSAVGASNLTRHSRFAYDPASGLVIAEIAEPQDTGALRLETDTLYDAFGNKHVTTAVGLAATPSGLATQSRSTTASYDARGQFATTLANALGESESWSYNGDYGTPASHTGPNGATTVWSYDSFGRVTRATDPDGTATLYSYTYCTTGCPANAAYFVQATPVGPDGQGNGAVTIAHYETLPRVGPLSRKRF
jgi:YD repeat-containing protein